MLPIISRSLPYFTEIIQPNLKYIFGASVTAATTIVGLSTFNEVLKAVSLLASVAVGALTIRKLIREERLHKLKVKKKGELNA
jgi:hypothetical protein